MSEFYLSFLLFSFFLFTVIRIYSLRLNKIKISGIALDKISVIIPFRNEEQSLPHLLESISIQQVLPNEILFINDHSEDKSTEYIQSFIVSHHLGKLLDLPVGITGKKLGLNYGIKNSKSRFILTLDADVILNEDYFNSFSILSTGGLSSLPAVMKGGGFLGALFSTEYSFFNAFNFLISSIWPISVSGANLLIDSKLIDYDEQLKSHQHLASGDDYFLLKEFRNKNLPIHIKNDFCLSIKTNAPNSLKSYFDQRVRWLSKSKFEINVLDSIVGIFILIYFLVGFLTLITAAISCSWILLGTTFVVRFLIDSLIYLNYAQRLRETKNVLMLPFFQLIYPVLFLGVLILALFYKPKWKGRKIE